MSFLYPMCSSSKGNCSYIGSQERGVLIDAGLGIRSFLSQLALIGVAKEAVRGIFVTHEHSDHVKGLSRIQKELQVPVYASQGTLSCLIQKGYLPSDAPMKVVDSKAPERIGSFVVSAFPTPHDSVESQAYQIHIQEEQKTVTVCTDLGYITEEIHHRLVQSDLLMLESNYDPYLLQSGCYPYFLKRRIAGSGGHLSNADCAAEISALYDLGVRHFVLGHLSEENNRPELAYANILSALERKGGRLQEDFTLSVAPKTNVGRTIPILRRGGSLCLQSI